METFPVPDRLVRFGTFEVDFQTGELRKSGVRLALQEQPLRILGALLAQPGAVVSREELRRRLWPEGTFVDFEHSLNAAVRRLRIALGDEADVPRFIETVHKRGYRFVALNEVFPLVASRHGRRSSPATIAHIVRKQARVAVLPFSPFDGFSDGLTEEAVTQLAQLCPRSIGVIARTSVERAQRGAGTVAEITQALGADYRVEGAIRREGERLRITAQLIEAGDETHLWAQTFDRMLTDALTLQMEVGAEIARGVYHTLDSTLTSVASIGSRVSEAVVNRTSMP
jgi:TolB-like protein